MTRSGRDEVFLNHALTAPKGVEGIDYEVPEETNEYNEFEDEVSLESSYEEDNGESGADEYAPEPPDSFVIVSQKVRTLPGGGQVVDIEVELPDPPDGYRHDIRTAKR